MLLLYSPGIHPFHVLSKRALTHGSYETSQLTFKANILAARPHNLQRLNFCFSCDVIQSYFHGKLTDTHLSKFMVYLAKLSRHICAICILPFFTDMLFKTAISCCN